MSKYHFDNFKNDPLIDKIDLIGKLTVGDGRKNELPSVSLTHIKNLFSLDNSIAETIILEPGQQEQMAIDDLSSYLPDQPWRITKIIIHLHDWERGHFCNYGNHIHTQWKAGQVFSYDWQNLPHSFANTSTVPLVTHRLTGIISERTTEFINRLKRFGIYNLSLE